jgi:endonuclease III
MTKKERYKIVLDYFQKTMGPKSSELSYYSPFQLVVAVMLSAQCTDKRVNMTTPAFFAAFHSPKELSQASFEQVYNLIKSISYPNNKAKHLIAMAKRIMSDFDGVVPSTVENLMKLEGVGRKTANVVTLELFGQPNMAVDTHVFRVSNRIGLTKSSNVLQCQKQLEANIPKDLIPNAHHWILFHGRYVCKARRPLCEECGLKSCCIYFSLHLFGGEEK